jgi:hypothetical protein
MPKLPDDDKAIIILEIPSCVWVANSFLGDLTQGMWFFSERVHHWKDLTGGIKMTFSSYMTLWKDYCSNGYTKGDFFTTDEAVMKNQGRGVQFLKFRAKTTGMCQPCDVGEGFKTMKAACKKTKVTIDDAALEQSVKQRLRQLRKQGKSHP